MVGKIFITRSGYDPQLGKHGQGSLPRSEPDTWSVPAGYSPSPVRR